MPSGQGNIHLHGANLHCSGVLPLQMLCMQGSDQHRGWFQSSLLTAAAVRGMAPHTSRS